MDILISHVSVVTMDEQLTVLTDAFLGVTDGKISYLSKNAPDGGEKPQKIIDGTGMVVMPGLINCHTHLPMTILRGVSDDCNLTDWLHGLWEKEARLDDRAVKASSLLAIAECLRFGVTSVSDMYDHVDAIAEAVAESGIKANLSRGATMFLSAEEFDDRTFPACKELREVTRKWNGYDGGRIRIEASIHGEYTSTAPFWDFAARFAQEEGLGMHVHLSETKEEQEGSLERNGLTPAQTLDCHRVFDGRTVAAHCVHLTEEDMRLLGRRKVTAVHCPVSNLKLASGRADVIAMVKNGMNVALGTDSVCSNNNLDLFEEMKLAALLAKELHGDASMLTASAALMMATVCGARAQGREAECGMLKPGMDADLCMLDFTQPHLIPCHDLMSHLVYAASGHDVVLTMVRGRILYAAGEYPTIDRAALMKELAEYAVPKVMTPEPEKEEEQHA